MGKIKRILLTIFYYYKAYDMLQTVVLILDEPRQTIATWLVEVKFETGSWDLSYILNEKLKDLTSVEIKEIQDVLIKELGYAVTTTEGGSTVYSQSSTWG